MIGIITFCCFFNLGTQAIQSWDEARHGVNAYEMLREGNYIANYYGDSLDYWNLKPPISYYFIMLGYKIFGYNALGLRFFSALSYLIIAIAVSLFMKKNYGKIQSLVSLIALGSFTFLFTSHCVRTADADALYLMFFTIGILALLSTKNNKNWIILTGFMFALMFLTKSWHAFVFVPIVFFYLIFTKGFKRIGVLRMLLFFLACIFPILIWAVARYNFDGWTFFETMLNYDLLERSSTAIESHIEPFYYYFIYLLQNCLPAILLCGVILFYKIKYKEKPSYDDIGCFVSFLSVLLIFTVAKTKISWYVYPCVIPLAIYASSNIMIFREFKVFKILKIVLFSVVSICMIVTFVYPMTLKNENSLQVFINSVTISEVYGADLYVEKDDSSSWTQGEFLSAELALDSHPKNGGWDSFLQDEGAYIIISASSFDNDRSLLVEILFQNENYYLCCLI